MNSTESRATASLALLFAIRMLGLFILLPILSVLGMELEGATPALLGLAIGIYGLTQAALQIPFGALSDRYGRKPFILFGLALFVLGSLIAAWSTTIWGVMIGRALQGSGAIGGVITALLADVTRPEVRTKAMAMIGASIGSAFLLALIIGPILGSLLGLQGLFLSIASLGIAGFIVALLTLPGKVMPKLSEGITNSSFDDEAPLQQRLLKTLKQPQLRRLFLGVLFLHLVQTTLFVALPQLLVETHHFDISQHWQLYLPVMMLSFVIIIPTIIFAEKKGATRTLVVSMILTMLASCLVMLTQFTSFSMLAMGLFLFFAGFNALEAMMPSVVSRIAPAGQRGICMSTYTTFQFFGAFLGGSLGGIIYAHYDFSGLIILDILVLSIWLLLGLGLSAPADIKAITISIEHMEPNKNKLEKILLSLPGVREVFISERSSQAHIKVDKKIFDNAFLEDLRLFSTQNQASDTAS